MIDCELGQKELDHSEHIAFAHTTSSNENGDAITRERYRLVKHHTQYMR
jgi:hypothetical protein